MIDNKLSYVAKDLMLADGLTGALAECYDRLASILKEVQALLPEPPEVDWSKSYAEMAKVFRDGQAQSRADTFPALAEYEQIKEFLENNELCTTWMPK